MTYADAKRALVLLGYPVDFEDDSSVVGPTTRQSIMAFQRDHGLPDHGMLDEDTKKKLEAETLGKAAPSSSSFDWNELLRFMSLGVGIAGILGVGYEFYLHSQKRSS